MRGGCRGVHVAHSCVGTIGTPLGARWTKGKGEMDVKIGQEGDIRGDILRAEARGPDHAQAAVL